MQANQHEKVIFITGTTSGIGKAVATYLHAKGFCVIGTYRTEPIDAPFRQVRLDITQDASIDAAIRDILTKEQKIDILINNAGYGISGPIEGTDIEMAKKLLDANFFGAVRMIQSVLPTMREQKKGKIINISSIAGLMGIPYQGFYSASKFALEGLVESLRMELKGTAIEVTNINPGDFKSSFTSKRQEVQISPENVYYETYHKVKNVFETDEANGSDPIKIAVLIEELILQKRKLKVRYLVGRPKEKISLTMKNMLDTITFEKVMSSNYSL